MRLVQLTETTREEREHAIRILRGELPKGTMLTVMPVERVGRDRDETLMKVLVIRESALKKRPRIACYSLLASRALGCEVETHISGPVVWTNAMNADPGLATARALGLAVYGDAEAYMYDRL